MRTLLAVLFALGFAALPAAAEEKVKVVATFSILGDIVGQIGGDRIAVSVLVPAQADAHVFRPTPAEARAVAGAKAVVANGLNFEPWLDRLIAASGFKGRRIVAAADIKPRRMGAHDHAGHDHGAAAKGAALDDPHVWHDLRRMETYIANIAAGLGAVDPAHAANYARRGAAYAAELRALDAWAAAAFEGVPRAHRKAITHHDAFGYLGDRFLVDFMAPQGASTDAEASAEGVARLIRQIRRQKVQALFFESVASPRLIEQIGKEAKVKVGGRLYSDSLSPPGGEADTFIRMYRLNVERLVAAMARGG